MSLTNPNTPISEQDLQDFYYKIKPYLGTDEMPASDMDEIITPLPGYQSQGVNYSTEEQVIGKWIDGKPLYQKTIVDTLASAGVIKYVKVGASVDQFVKTDVFICPQTKTFIFSHFITTINEGTNFHLRWVAYNNNGTGEGQNSVAVMYENNNSSSDWDNKPLYVTVQYTKTTD